MPIILKAGTLSTNLRANGSSKLSLELFFVDSATGQGKTALTKASFTKFGLSLAGAAVIDYTSTMVDLITIGDAYTPKGFKEKDAAKDPGRYRFDIPVADAANIAGGNFAWSGTGILDSGDTPSSEISFVNYDPDVPNPDINSIKIKTDNLPADPTSAATVSAATTAILNKTPDATVYTNTRGAKLDQLDAAVSTRLASGGYTAPDNATIGTINSKIGTPAATVSLDIASRAATGAAMALTPSERVTMTGAIWNEPTSAHQSAGTTGKALTDAQAAGDPLAAAVPGSYSPGTAGKVLGDLTGAKTDTAAIKLKTDNLPADPADASDIATATGSIITAVGALPSAVANADALLGRNQKGGSNSSPHVSDALAGGLMKFTINPSTGVMTVLNGDGTTAYTRTLTRQQLDAIISSS